MPYIEQIARDRLSRDGQYPTTPGEVNYLVSVMIANHVRRHPDGLRYHVINDVIAQLETVIHGNGRAALEKDSLAHEIIGMLQLVRLPVLQVVGAVRCAQMEFYRRVAAPYEDAAIKKNGDVYPPEGTV